MLPFDAAAARPGEVRVLDLDGEVDQIEALRLERRLDEAVDDGVHTVVVDLSAAEWIGSAALGALLRALRRLHRRGGGLVLVCDRPAILRVLRLTRCERRFEVVSAREEALRRAFA